MRTKYPYLLIIGIFLMVGLGVYSNVMQQRSIDRSKLPAKIEESNSFQRWITNIKNNNIDIDADGFRLKEETEIYNTKWMKVYSADDEETNKQYMGFLESHRGLDNVIFSPSNQILIDYRNEPRDGYNSNEVHLYGKLEDKIIDARVVDCSTRANCIFDRAYFMENDIFTITEFSRNIDKKDDTIPLCRKDEVCEYTFKLHLIDLKNNSRLIYESQPFKAVYNDLVPEL